MRKVILLLALLIGTSVKAEVLLDLGAGLISDKINSGSTTTSDQSSYGLGVLFNFRKGMWAGWNYASQSDKRGGSTTATLSGTDTGPAFLYQFGKGQMYVFGFTYNLLAKATFDAGSTQESWDGTSYNIKLGVMPEISSGFHVGFMINSYSASFNKVTIAGTQTSSSNTRTFMYPSIQLTKEW